MPLLRLPQTLLTAVLTLGSSLAMAASADSAQPNILLIVADDLSNTIWRVTPTIP